MGGWVELQTIPWSSMTEDDASGHYASADVSGELEGTLSGSTSDRGDGVYAATVLSGVRLRRWKATIPSWPTKTFNAPSWWKLGLYGSTNTGAVPNRSVGLWVELGSTSNTGYRAVNVHWLSGGVYQALAAWADGDLPIVLEIEEQTLFSGSEGSVHYHVYWTKTGGAQTLLWDSGVRATPGYWAASRICLFQSGYYTSVTRCSELAVEVYDEDGPTITETPTDGTNPVSTAPELSYTTTDLAGVDAAAEVIIVDGDTAWTGEAEQSGFTVARTAIEGGYQYTIRRTQPFTPGEVVSWTVHSEDAVGNITESTFTFTCSTSTVAADLAQQSGVPRVLFAKIEGYEPILIENVGDAPVGWSRSLLKCLVAPEEEFSIGLDLAEMKIEPPTMMIELENIDDATDPTKKHFAKLFAPGAITATGVKTARIKEATGTDREWISASATTIDADGATAFTAPGTAYVGQETFSFTGVSSAGFTGCSRGLYPPIGSTYCAHTYKRPFAGEADGRLLISSRPYTWIGRRIALYLATYDVAAGAWHHDSEALLIWCGRIAETIRYSPTLQRWQLQCVHVLGDGDKSIVVDMPRGQLQGINLNGPQGLSITVEEGHKEAYWDGAKWVERIVMENSSTATIGAGWYGSPDSVAAALTTALDAATVGLDISSWGLVRKGDRFSLIAYNNNTSHAKYCRIKLYDSANVGSIALRALGFELRSLIVEDDIPEFGPDGYLEIAAEGEPFVAFHPLGGNCNGGKLGAQGAYYGDVFWHDQGDWDGGQRACVEIGGAYVSEEKPEVKYLTWYNDRGYEAFVDGTSGEAQYLVVDGSPRRKSSYPSWCYVGQREGSDPVYVSQRYVPTYLLADGTTRGPFEMLLFPLLSSGTTAANHATYDACPLELAVGVPAALVDIQSFLAADAIIAASPLAVRDCYVIDEPIKWIELLQRECKLFGFFLSWDMSTGRLKLQSITPTADSWVETLNDDVRGHDEEWVEPESSLDTVVNFWRIKCNYDLDSDEYMLEIPTRDQDSIESLGITKSVELEHPGVRITEAYARTFFKEELLGRMMMLRFPWQRVSITLAPAMLARLSIGDWSSYVGSHHPDPYGSGAMTAACLSVATNLAWPLGGDNAMIGRSDQLLCCRYDATTMVPWAAGALIDRAATNGGWDAANARLTLVARQYDEAVDNKGGAAFERGDKVRIRQINNSGYALGTAKEWDNLEVGEDFETDGANILTLSGGTTLTGWDSAQEYVVEPSHYADTTADQKVRNAWQADLSTRLLGGADRAQRWG